MVKQLKTNNMNFKVACTGSSGSGKTTLVKFIAQAENLKHISGSAGDIKTGEDRDFLLNTFNHPPGMGHLRVIQQSALDYNFGITNQNINLHRRSDIIFNNDNFITDRSPLDNLTYMINQVGFHPEISDESIDAFAFQCMQAWNELTHVIYIKPCQPTNVENNGSRIHNKWYQQAVDAQFEFWLRNYFRANQELTGPKLLVINVWNWEIRKEMVIDFLKRG